MATQIGLLRAVNVGGTGNIAMPALRMLLADLGFADIKTVLQSGNLVFRSDRCGGRELEALLENAASDRASSPQTPFAMTLPAIPATFC
jgi:uncharacterized protein (DUF1697 family)